MESFFDTYADYLPVILAVLVTMSLFAAYQISRDRLAERHMLRTLRFVSEWQYRSATDAEIGAMVLFAREHLVSDMVDASIKRMRDAHGHDLKVGHLWWLQQQIFGRIPWDALPPPCAEGMQGLGDHSLSKSLPLNL